MKEKQDVTIEDYKELRINLAHTDSKVQGLSAALFRVLLVPCHFKHNATKPPYLKGSWGGGRLQPEDGVRKDKLFPFEG